jgi:cytochrome b
MNRVWDPLVRLLHWTLVGAVTIAWTSTLHIGVPGHWHEIAGFVAMGAVALRVLWGFVGPRHARFASFVRGPAPTFSYLKQMSRGQAPRYIGHNPLGGWMVVALLLTVGAITFTGWLQTTDEFWGSETLETVHTVLAWGLLALIALHVMGVVHTSAHQRENLVRAMLNGRKRPQQTGDVD